MAFILQSEKLAPLMATQVYPGMKSNENDNSTEGLAKLSYSDCLQM